MDPQTMTPVPADGETIGEVMFRGNIVMKGYLKNPSGQRRSLRRRLVPFRRSRRALSGRLHPAQGSLEGHHHLRAARTSPRSRSRTCIYKHPAVAVLRRGRQAGREVGRDAVRLRRAAAGHGGDRRRAPCLVPRPAGALQVPAPHRVCGSAAHVDRQNSKVQAARDGEGRLTPDPDCRREKIHRRSMQRSMRQAREDSIGMRRGGEASEAARLGLLVARLAVAQTSDLVFQFQLFEF